ncbi:MAG TPA: RnfABCDGE type electron transport complex subunit D [Xanthomonadaceae bacterium]|nr:RnfABCDGE type electron transport complex subunit D [Xanthomonadaceae bacterium]
MRTFSTAGAPHTAPATDVRRVMLLVLLALLPGVLAHLHYFGPGVLVQIAIALAAAHALEAAMLRARGAPMQRFLLDGSAAVAAVLFALCIPPLAPWWITVVGMLAAIVFAKHLYGGIGHNLFNPAMVAFAVVLVCFPFEMSQWLPPRPLAGHAIGLVDALRAIFLGELPAGLGWDAVAGATPLETVRHMSSEGRTLTEIRADPLFGDFGGRGWEWIANWYAIGGLFLLLTRVITWHVPVAVLGTTILLTLPFHLLDPDFHPFPLQHVFSGALVLGAFFIATDPVTGCSTPRGRLIFGAGVAVLTLAIRRWGAYPDGVAFAVLLMNCAAPLIDRYSAPRIFGRPK